MNDFDQNVIDLAAIMARNLQAALHLVHVTLFPNTTHKGACNYFGKSSVFNREHNRLMEMLPELEDVETYHHHLTGYPAEMVLRLAEKTDPCLLVMGTHGRMGVSRLFGSVSSEILRRASCPVMMLRQDENNQRIDQALSNSATADPPRPQRT